MGATGDRPFSRRLGVAVAGIAVFVALVAASAALAASSATQGTVLTRSSTFDASNEAWVSIDRPNLRVASWQSSDGNPGGYITGQFNSGIGIFQSVPSAAGSTWPAGEALGDYGGTVAADLRVSYFGLPSTTAVIVGFFSFNTSVIPCQLLGSTSEVWTTYTATLDENHLSNCNTGLPLAGAQVTAALAGFDGMIVYAGDTHSVAATVDLDNAVLAGPSVGASPPTGSVTRALKLAYSSHVLRGTLTAAYDYSCAGKIKVSVFRKHRRAAVGTAITGAPNLLKPDGPSQFSFRLKKIVPGTYYVRVRHAKSSLDGNTCVDAMSSGVRVH